jgi:hypothetical protein
MIENRFNNWINGQSTPVWEIMKLFTTIKTKLVLKNNEIKYFHTIIPLAKFVQI